MCVINYPMEILTPVRQRFVDIVHGLCQRCKALGHLFQPGGRCTVLLRLGLPESPMWLKARGREQEAEDIVRKGEAIYKTEFEGRTLSEAEWLDALVAHPILIERPIVVRGERAVIGRPPERVLELL